MDTPFVRFISFEGNAIRNVGQDLVTYLYDLEYLSFRRNLCVNREASTPEEILTLGMQLPAICPPVGQPALTTVPPTTVPLDVCPHACLDPIVEAVQQELLSFSERLEELEAKIEGNSTSSGTD